MNYNELMEMLTDNKTGGLSIELGYKGKFAYLTGSGAFVGRLCRVCNRVMQSDQLAKNSAAKFGHDTICLSCVTARMYKKRECAEYVKKEREQQNNTIEGHIRKIIRNLRLAGRRYYGIEILLPTDAERSRLMDRLQTALENGICAYSGKPMDRSNISSEHLVPIKRHDSIAFDMIGSWYDSIIFVTQSENSRKNARSFLEYAQDWTDAERYNAQDRIAASLGVPIGTVEQAMMLDDLETLLVV